ncbi:MAG: lipopolysaccharide biosynthesis protein [Paucibacter sp.]|nr:lipopolysaccharide biosynthesis protein [Roseateles sp.]
MNKLRARIAPGLNPRTRRLLNTAAAGYLARFGSAATLLVTIPLARRQLEPELFGVWMMLSTLLGFFAFADLGVGNGVLNRMTAAHGAGRREEAGRVIVAGYFCTAAMGLLMLAAWYAWMGASTDPLRFAGAISSEHRNEVLSAFCVFVGLMALNLPIGMVQKLQLGCQDGQWVGITQFGASMATLLAVPAALYWRLGLSALVLASLGTQVVANLLSSLAWLRHRGYLGLVRPALLHRAEVRGLLHSGLWFFVLQLSAAFAFQSDAFVIAQLLGQSAYGDFAAVQKVFLSLSSIFGAALLGLWPAFGEALNNGDLAWARRTLARALLTGLLVMGGLCIAALLSMDWISRLWLHMETPPPILLPLVLATWTVMDTLGAICGSFLNGAGVLRAQVLVALSMAATAFAGKWWLVTRLGAPGATLATIVAYGLISAPALIFLLRQLFQQRSTVLRVVPVET